MDETDISGLRDLWTKPEPAPAAPAEDVPRYRLRLRCHPPERLIGRLSRDPAPARLLERGGVTGRVDGTGRARLLPALEAAE